MGLEGLSSASQVERSSLGRGEHGPKRHIYLNSLREKVECELNSGVPVPDK